LLLEDILQARADILDEYSKVVQLSSFHPAAAHHHQSCGKMLGLPVQAKMHAYVCYVPGVGC
jgi:hypothetical protein